MRKSLPKHEIIRGYREFSRILSRGQSIQSENVRCFYIAQKGHGPVVRVGFAVSRNVRKATERNRLRRLLRESYRLQKDVLGQNVPPDLEISAIFLVLSEVRSATRPKRFSEIRRDMEALLCELRNLLRREAH